MASDVTNLPLNSTLTYSEPAANAGTRRQRARIRPDAVLEQLQTAQPAVRDGSVFPHNPAPGPADQPFLYGHVWVTISLALRHPKWGPLALPLLTMLYVRKRTMATIPNSRRWHRFATKLQLAARLVEWIVPIMKNAGKTVWIVIDGGYTKRPFLRRVLKLANVVVVGRLRKAAALRDLPPPQRKGQRPGRGRPRKYGKNKISLAKRAGQRRGWHTVECILYNETVTKTYKSFLAT